jgi:hypothetical protein
VDWWTTPSRGVSGAHPTSIAPWVPNE